MLAEAPADAARGVLDTPLGPFRVAATLRGLVASGFAGTDDGDPPGAGSGEGPARAHVAEALAQLADYFEGRRRDFDLPLAPEGPPFHLRVWRALAGIPYGSTLTYGALARRVGCDPAAARAVGQACRRNPLGVIVPCHRVVGASGSLTGYAGGVEIKRWLLRHEARLAPGSLFGEHAQDRP